MVDHLAYKDLSSWLPSSGIDGREVTRAFLERLCLLADAQFAHLRLASRTGHYFAMVDSIGPYMKLGWSRRLQAIDGREVRSIAYSPQRISDLTDCQNLHTKYSSRAEAREYFESLRWGMWIPLASRERLEGYAVVHWSERDPKPANVAKVEGFVESMKQDLVALLTAGRWVVADMCQRRMWRTLGALHVALNDTQCHRQIARLCVRLWGDICTAYVGLPENNTNRVQVVEIFGHRQEAPRPTEAEAEWVPPGEGVFGHVLERGEACILPDLRKQGGVNHYSVTRDLPVPGSAIGTTVVAPGNGDTLAVISVESEYPLFFDHGDLNYLGYIATVAGHSLAALRQSSDRRRQELDSAFTELCHDVAEPLQAVVADAEVLQYQTEMVKEGRSSSRNRRQVLKDVVARAGNIMATIDDLYVYVRGHLKTGVDGVASPPGSGRLNLRRAVAELIDIWSRRAATMAIDMLISLEGIRGIVVQCDATEFRMAIGHILGNAVKYSYSGSRDVRRHVRIRGSVYLGRAVIDVENYGVGIQEHELQRVKERYYRGTLALEEGRAGTGQGLWRANRFLMEIGGALEIESEFKGSEEASQEGPWWTRVRAIFPIAEDEQDGQNSLDR